MISPIFEMPSPYMMSNSTCLNGGASGFLTTLTRVGLQTTSPRSALAAVARPERVPGSDEGADAALLLRVRQAVQRERGLARGGRAIDLDHPAARQAADAERDIEAERAGGDRVDIHRLVVLAEPHD